MRRRLRGLSERDWRVIDRVMVGSFVVLAWIDVTLSPYREGPLVWNLLLVTAMGAALLLRRSQPLVALGAVIVGALLGELLLTGAPDLLSVVLMVITASYSTAAHLPLRRALIGLFLGAGGICAVSAIFDPSEIFFPVTFFGILPWVAGRTIRNQTRLARELAEKAARAEHERDEEERRAIATERRRVARELHDVLAHDLSVMVVQASAGRRLVETDPDQAVDAAKVIARTGREAMTELRHLFGAVRREEGEPLEGLPSLSRLDRLADRAREAGLSVSLRVEGEPVALPTGVDLTAYRVVQEALTNTIRHAGEAEATVTVRYEPWEVVVEVEDDGAGPRGGTLPLGDVGGGNGLLGMRERVAVYGGLLQAGRRRGGGFAVRARLPTISTPEKEVVH